MSDERPHIFGGGPVPPISGVDITALLQASGGAWAIIAKPSDAPNEAPKVHDFGTFTEWTLANVIAQNAARYPGPDFAHCYVVRLPGERDLSGSLARLTAQIEHRGRPLHRDIHVVLNETGLTLANAWRRLSPDATAEHRRAWIATVDDFRSLRDRIFMLCGWPERGESTKGRPDAPGLNTE